MRRSGTPLTMDARILPTTPVIDNDGVPRTARTCVPSSAYLLSSDSPSSSVTLMVFGRASGYAHSPLQADHRIHTELLTTPRYSDWLADVPELTAIRARKGGPVPTGNRSWFTDAARVPRMSQQ